MIAAFMVPKENPKREYIDREKVIAEIDDCFPVNPTSEFSKGVAVGVAMAKIAVNHTPAADVRPVKRASWEDVEVIWLADIEDQPDAIASMFCPKCKRFANHVYHYGNPTDGMNFCPNCGTDMRNLQSDSANANNSEGIANNTEEGGE